MRRKAFAPIGLFLALTLVLALVPVSSVVAASEWCEVETWTNYISPPEWHEVQSWTNYSYVLDWHEVGVWTNYVETPPLPEWCEVGIWINYMESYTPEWCEVQSWAIYFYVLDWHEVATWTNDVNTEALPSAPSVFNVYVENIDNVLVNVLDVDTWYRFNVEIYDNKTLAGLENVTLILFLDNENLPDNVVNHYTFRWTRGDGFEEVGPDG